jgi:hypothetical protein
MVGTLRHVASQDQTQRVPAIQRAASTHPLLKMQRKYGNRYVQRALDAAATGQGEAEIAPEISEAIERQRGLGQPLDHGTRSQMESAFGSGFQHVRVHTGIEADQLNRAVNARAFTTGRDIFFRVGEYSPNSFSGRELLAHELTHVVQQTGTVHTKLTISQPGDRYEQEADRIAHAVMQRQMILTRQVPIPANLSASPWRVQRQFGFLTDVTEGIIDRASNYIRERAQSIPGYDLLGVILGRDPITQRPVERNATNLLRGLLGLIPGGTQMFENLQQSRVIERAFNWVSGELTRLNLTWGVIRGAIERFLRTLGPGDAFNLGGVFDRARAIFGPIVASVISFARSAGSRILEFIFEGALALGGGAAQRVLAIFRRIGATFSMIVNDPVRFLQNLLNAVLGGFRQFGTNILTHLRTAIFDWLFGALQGVGLQLPQRFDMRGIVSIILQILGLTYARLRARLVRLIGERPVQMLEQAFDFLRILVTQGIAAAWEKIIEYAQNLTDTVIEGIKTWIRNTIVGQAIQQIASLLTPVGAVIQAIIKIYNTVMFVIERAQQIVAFVESVIDSIDNIARGNINAAINYVERTLARILPLVISFLARFIGLGGISNQIRQIVQRIQSVVDRAIDRVLDWIRERARALLERAAGGTPEQRLQSAVQAAQSAVDRLSGARVTMLLVRPVLRVIQARYQLRVLEPINQSGRLAIRGVINPEIIVGTTKYLISEAEDRSLQALATRFANRLRQNESERQRFESDPVAYLRNPQAIVEIGDIVEDIGRPRLETYARNNRYGIWLNTELHLYGNQEQQLTRGNIRELDGILLRPGSLERVISVKSSRSSFGTGDRSRIETSLAVYFNPALRRQNIRESNKASRALAVTNQNVGGEILESFREVRIKYNNTSSMELGEFQVSYARSMPTRFLVLTPYETAETTDQTAERIYLSVGEQTALRRDDLVQIVAQAVRARLQGTAT